MDDFILKNGLRWIPYNKFKNVEYLNEGGFGTIYRAIWLKNNGDKEDEDDEDDEEEEWEYHASVLASSDIIEFYGFTKNPNTSKYMVVMDYANKVSEGLNKCLIKDLGSIDENTSKLNEILESEGSQATRVKANEMLVSEDLSDYIIKDLRSLDIKTDEN
ncbi:unnamed protein product [Rhizophagus irregularis]|nr:unnamed protein product [Rhizophagus irregularis]